MGENNFECTDHDVHTALLWSAFGRGANMPFDADCVDVAVSRGYYEQVRKNCEIFQNDAEQLNQAMTCCLRAGRIAAGLATDDEHLSIDRGSFEKACIDLELRILKIRENRKGKDYVSVMAGVCG